MAIPPNPFEWSVPRHEIFQLCLRRYWFSYYSAWGGWLPEAPAASRRAYACKRLSTGVQWTGHHLHALVSRILRDRARITPADVDALCTRALETMRAEFRDSRVGAYRQNPARIVGLFEHEYNLDVSPADWKALVDRVPASIHSFCTSSVFASLRTVPDSALIDIPRRSGFTLSGLRVSAAPDFALRRPDGTVLLCDWKTGITPLADSRLQQAVCVLLALDLGWAADPSAVTALACHLVTGETIPFTFTAAELDDIRDFIRDSADEMLFPLEDPSVNAAPDPTPFDPAESPAPCPTCPFLSLCPKWSSSRPPR